MTGSNLEQTISQEKYVSVATFRKTGVAVATATWIVPLDGGRVGLLTSSASGKAKRLRNNPSATLQPSDVRGRVKAGTTPVTGTVALVTSGPDFEAITSKDNRPSMLVPLEHGKPVRFGPDGEKGVVIDGHGSAVIVEVSEVGEEALLVHDESRADPSLAFALSRLANGPYSPTPIGVFRAIERPDYGSLVQDQLVAAAAKKGPGDLTALLRSGTTWTVE